MNHLKRSVPEQFCNTMQLNPRHNKSTGKRRAVAMPRIIRHLRVIERGRKPPARALHGVPGARRERPARSPAERPCTVTDREQPGPLRSAESPADRRSRSSTDRAVGARNRSVSSEACTAHSSVATDKRERWYDRKLKAGIEVLICNPKLVETGLDLLALFSRFSRETSASFRRWQLRH